MRDRALAHVAGLIGAGKTTFIERLLDAEVAFAICVRAERDVTLQEERESAPKMHAELRRYREAGASAQALYRFAEPSADAFFTSDVMQCYSEAVFIEGDCPVDYVELSVFVAPPPQEGRSLLRRVVRDHAAVHRAVIERLARAIESPEAMADLLRTALAEPLVARVLEQPRVRDEVRRSMDAELSDWRREKPPAPTEHWALEDGYAGIERAHLIVVNVRADADRLSAQAFVDDVVRLRKDEDVFRDVLRLRGSRLPVTALVADLSNPKDAGTKKAVARVKRTTRRRPQ